MCKNIKGEQKESKGQQKRKEKFYDRVERPWRHLKRTLDFLKVQARKDGCNMSTSMHILAAEKYVRKAQEEMFEMLKYAENKLVRKKLIGNIKVYISDDDFRIDPVYDRGFTFKD